MLSYILLPVLRNKKPCSYLIEFFDPVDKFTLKDANGKIYYYRYLDNKCRKIKINVPDPGIYTTNVNCIVIEKPLIVIPEVFRIKLPPEERNRTKDYFIEHSPNLTSSPAIIYTDIGKIVTGLRFKDFSIPMKIFILLHEVGHFKYETESYCDLFAFVEFMKMGYNASTAIYCMTDVLKNNPDSRINFLYNIMEKNKIVK